MKIRIPAKSTIPNCELALAELQAARAEPSYVEIPTKLKYRALGAEISWVQYFVTYVKKFNSLKLFTYAKEEKDEQVEYFTKRLIGTVASLCATEVRSTLNSEVLTKSYKTFAFDRLQKLQENRPETYTVGQNVEVVAGDDFTEGTPASLYPEFVDQRRVIGSRGHFISTVKRLLRVTLPNRYQSVYDSDDTCEALGTLLYETYKNTEDHAKIGLDGNMITNSFRIMQSSFTADTPQNLQNVTEGFEPMNRYVKKFSPANEKSHLTFVSLSILDSGPGFAQSLTSKPLNRLNKNEELEATIACFSSRTRKVRPEYGKGLEMVRKYLHKQKGFLRLRTGRLSLYYDSTTDKDFKTDIPLNMWTMKQRENLPKVEGALLTMHLPVGDTR